MQHLSILKLVNDDSIHVRWTSLQCLLKLSYSNHSGELMVQIPGLFEMLLQSPKIYSSYLRLWNSSLRLHIYMALRFINLWHHLSIDCMMVGLQPPSEDFIDIVIILAREDIKEQKRYDDADEKSINNNSDKKYVVKRETKQSLKERYEEEPDGADRVVSWLLYLMTKATVVVIKEKSVQLFDRLMIKQGHYFIERLSDEMVGAVKVETIELLKSAFKNKLTYTFKKHLMGLVQSFAFYLVPTGRWDTLRPTLETILNEEKGSSPSLFKENARVLLELISKHDFETIKRDFWKEMIKCNYFTKLSKEQQRSFMPDVLSTLDQIDEMVEGEFMERIMGSIAILYLKKDRHTKWMEEFIQQIIDILIKRLDKYRIESSSKKIIVYDFLMDIVENDPQRFNDSHLEIILSHLFDWLTRVDEISLEEWTDKHYNHKNQYEVLNDYDDEEKDCEIFYTDHRHGCHDSCDDLCQMVDADIGFHRFVGALGDRVGKSIFNHFNNLLNSQQWNQRYAALVSLSRFCAYLPDVTIQFPNILKTVLKFVNDNSIQVRWASLQCLLKLSNEDVNRKSMIESRQEIFKVIVKSVRNPNERIQGCCCALIQQMIYYFGGDMIIDNENALKEISGSFEILLQSPKIFVVERALVSLMMKHQSLATKETRVLRWRAIKALPICGFVVVKKTYSTYENRFMAFIKENEGSLDLALDVLKSSHMFVQLISQKSMAELFSIIMKRIINAIEISLPNQQEISRETMLALKALEVVFKGPEFEKIYQPLTPFIDRLVDILCKVYLTKCTASIGIQLHSNSCLSGCVKLVKLKYGDRSHKTKEMFSVIYHSVFLSCLLEPNWSELSHRVGIARGLIREMGSEMSLDLIKSTMDVIYQLENRIKICVGEQVRKGNGNHQYVIGKEEPDEILCSIADIVSESYQVIGELVRYNLTVMSPLITQDFLDKACKILGDMDESNVVKDGILTFMDRFCQYGGEVAINAFPQIIRTIIKCLQIDDTDVRQTACVALDGAAQSAQGRFIPWAMDTLLAIDTMISTPSPSMNNDLKEQAIAVIGSIILNVRALPTHNINLIIPNWLGYFPLDENEEGGEKTSVSNLCEVIRLYPDECFGKKYQRASRLLQIIEHHYLKTTRDQQSYQELLSKTLTFIQESVQLNWHKIPLDKRDVLSRVYKQPTVGNKKKK
ncbi:hypothetical protein DFA_00501 [Cavenderia fasciculata]|uniref:Uncharacterized protein n=1 Tax=Cavenderia fasciculata TaxID=261658 RepID=F4PS94_CACFS|nr:uncharacterized protein DFA_00501 [Cavenderia fasciculata]EGG20640.1 hypothetical protein DFA_00501 [Cavenderia fasciculata]|eukprot:XP_004358490.1 hypothetical protein DFA_00501 [Cavenderia fasciculata]